MKATLITSVIALVCYLPVAQGAIYHYVFTGTLDSQIPSSEDSGINISAPISGTLTLDVTGTGEEELLIPENFPTTAAEFQLLVGKSIQISASETKVARRASRTLTTSSSDSSLTAAIDFKPANMATSSGSSFPATLVIATPGDLNAQELPLDGLEVTFNPTLLGDLSIGEEAPGGLSGSFNFGVGANAQQINFTATNVSRETPEDTVSPYIQREWRNLQFHLASIGLTEAIDEISFGINTSRDFDIPGIPEHSSASVLLGLASLFAIARRKR